MESLCNAVQNTLRRSTQRRIREPQRAAWILSPIKICFEFEAARANQSFITKHHQSRVFTKYLLALCLNIRCTQAAFYNCDTRRLVKWRHVAAAGSLGSKQVAAAQTPARKVSQMVWMRTVITYLLDGESERHAEREKRREWDKQSQLIRACEIPNSVSYYFNLLEFHFLCFYLCFFAFYANFTIIGHEQYAVFTCFMWSLHICTFPINIILTLIWRRSFKSTHTCSPQYFSDKKIS